jgi:hypothetical protein
MVPRSGSERFDRQRDPLAGFVNANDDELAGLLFARNARRGDLGDREKHFA